VRLHCVEHKVDDLLDLAAVLCHALDREVVDLELTNAGVIRRLDPEQITRTLRPRE
jgi:hypothetical protein